MYDTTPLVRILDEDVNTGPHTPFSPDRRYVVRPSMVVDPEIRLAVGNGIMDRDSIQGAVATGLQVEHYVNMRRYITFKAGQNRDMVQNSG